MQETKGSTPQDEGRNRETEYLQIYWSNARKTVPDQGSYSVTDMLLNGRLVLHVTNITRHRGVFKDTPKGRTAEQRIQSRRAVSARCGPTKTEQQ